ncbi:MAG TPA: MFS transporter [Mycobacteriales bacterium]|nr:MFS transporter [Mycobacteriales bacterium]
MLFALNLVDEFDRITFATLVPEIRDDFGLSDAALVAVGSMSAALPILLAVPLGYLADRFDRARISAVGAALWGCAAIATAFAPVVLVIAAARLAAGTGRLVNDVVHPSLLADHYPLTALPRVTAVHRVASSVGAVLAGLLAGALAVWLGWRATFLVMALPTAIAVGWAALVLREPRSAGREIGGGTHVPARQALRVLGRKRTFRPLWLASLLYGGAFIPMITTVLTLLLDREYGVGPAGRGAIQSLYAFAAAAGLALGVWAARRAFTRDEPGRLLSAVAAFLAIYGVGLVLLGLVRSLPVSVALVVLLGVGSYGYAPAYFTVIAHIAPSHIRSQAYACTLFFFAVGGVLSAALTATVVDRYGVRVAVQLLAALGLTAALFARSAAKLVRGDVECEPTAAP